MANQFLLYMRTDPPATPPNTRSTVALTSPWPWRPITPSSKLPAHTILEERVIYARPLSFSPRKHLFLGCTLAGCGVMFWMMPDKPRMADWFSEDVGLFKWVLVAFNWRLKNSQPIYELIGEYSVPSITTFSSIFLLFSPLLVPLWSPTESFSQQLDEWPNYHKFEQGVMVRKVLRPKLAWSFKQVNKTCGARDTESEIWILRTSGWSQYQAVSLIIWLRVP